MGRKRNEKPAPRVVVAVRISPEARAILTARLRDCERLSDRLRDIIERAARRAA